MDNSVTLEIQGVCIKCDRTDLIANSDYFKAMFEGNFVESEKKNILLKDVELEAMNLILKLLWDPGYPIVEEMILSVLQTSSMLQFLEVKEKCLQTMQDLLNMNNCLKFWLYTEQLDLKFYKKAKLMALTEFMTVKDTDYFLEMNFEEILHYLGNIYLQCDKEIDVFKAIVKWCENLEEITEEKILKLLMCLDFTKISEEQFEEIITTAVIQKFQQIVDILKCTKIFDHSQFPEFCIEKAKILMNCKSRNSQGFPCVLAKKLSKEKSSEDVKFFCDMFGRKRKYTVIEKDLADKSVFWLKNSELKILYDVESISLKWDGLKIVGYKHFTYLMGGELILGKGYWNNYVIVYDLIREQWVEKELKFPYPRRHFVTCVCKDDLFIIGGTGPFRIVQENMFWYNFKDGKWSERVKLPCQGRQIKCCQFNSQLFVLNINSKYGYIFDCVKKEWSPVEVCDNENILPSYSKKLLLFSYKDHLYIKEKKLFKMKLLRDNGLRLDIEQQIDIADGGNNCISESIICGQNLYTLNKQVDEKMTLNLTIIDMENIEKGIDNFEIIHDEQHCKFMSSMIIFSVFHHNLFSNKDLINDYLLN